MNSAIREQYFAEIIEASISSWKAVCWQWNKLPEFGSVVAIEQQEITCYALVSGIETGSKDPGRVPFAYQKSFEELAREQPQIFQLLQSTFQLIPLGYKQNNKYLQILPARPPLIHSFVRDAQVEELKPFFGSFDCLSLILSSDGRYLDELLICLIRFMASKNLVDQQFLEGFFEKFSLLGSDYKKLRQIIQKTGQMLA